MTLDSTEGTICSVTLGYGKVKSNADKAFDRFLAKQIMPAHVPDIVVRMEEERVE
jgi:hypothetical protein